MRTTLGIIILMYWKVLLEVHDTFTSINYDCILNAEIFVPTIKYSFIKYGEIDYFDFYR